MNKQEAAEILKEISENMHESMCKAMIIDEFKQSVSKALQLAIQTLTEDKGKYAQQGFETLNQDDQSNIEVLLNAIEKEKVIQVNLTYDNEPDMKGEGWYVDIEMKEEEPKNAFFHKDYNVDFDAASKISKSTNALLSTPECSADSLSTNVEKFYFEENRDKWKVSMLDMPLDNNLEGMTLRNWILQFVDLGMCEITKGLDLYTDSEVCHLVDWINYIDSK